MCGGVGVDGSIIKLMMRIEATRGNDECVAKEEMKAKGWGGKGAMAEGEPEQGIDRVGEIKCGCEREA